MDSGWTPDGLLVDSSWTPVGLRLDSWCTPVGLLMDCRRTPPGVLQYPWLSVKCSHYGGGGKRGGERSEEVGGGYRLSNERWMGQGDKELRRRYTTCQNQPRTPEGCQVVRSQEAFRAGSSLIPCALS